MPRRIEAIYANNADQQDAAMSNAALKIDREASPLAEAAPPMLAVNNIEVVYNDVILVLRGLSLKVPQGQIVALLGSNGAGKSTHAQAIIGTF